MSEGAAVSKKNLKIAFAETQATDLPRRGFDGSLLQTLIFLILCQSSLIKKRYMKAKTGTACWKRRIFMIMIRSSPLPVMNPMGWLLCGVLTWQTNEATNFSNAPGNLQ